MASSREIENCNDMFQNTQIVMTLLRLLIIVMASIKKTLKTTAYGKNTHAARKRGHAMFLFIVAVAAS
jgi:hypothetical protein